MTVVYGGAEYPAYVIDPESLREELLDEDEAREWCEETPNDPYAVSFWRMLGELDRALRAGEERLLEHEPGSPAWAGAAVRLAQVHHWRGEYADAHELLDAAATVFEGDAARTALVLAHRATVLLDQGRPAEARTPAARALALRERSGDPGLVASSRQVLARIDRDLRPSA